jgi:probable phosphoglycerate mutase
VLWRHGRTSWNAVDRFQGHLDIALDEVGRDQARRAAAVLAALRPAAIMSSDLVRAVDTAAALAAVTGVEVTVDPRLRETYGGWWQGKTVEEIRSNDAASYDAWRYDSHVDVPAGGGETRSQLAARVLPAITGAVLAAAAGSTVVVVSHGGTLRTATGALLGLPTVSWSALAVLANCCWSVLEERVQPDRSASGWRLIEHNAGTLPEPVLGDEH